MTIGAAIGASIGGAIGQMDFGRKLIGNIISPDTINGIKSIVTNIKDTNAAIAAFRGSEERVLVQELEKQLEQQLNAFDFVGAFVGGLKIVEDLLIIVGDVIGGVFGAESFGLKMSNAIRSGVDIVISYFATIPDRFRLIGAKIDAKVTEALSFDILGKRIGANRCRDIRKQGEFVNLTKRLKTE